MTVPYIGHLSHSIPRVLRKSGVFVHMKPLNTLWGRLVHAKDKVDCKDKTGVVYHITCSHCDAGYVGETERCLKKRLNEHKRSSSPVGHNMIYNEHSFHPENVSIVHQEPGWYCRLIAQAVHMSWINRNLKQDRGCHILPAIYKEITTLSDLPFHKRSRDSSTTIMQLPSVDKRRWMLSESSSL